MTKKKIKKDPNKQYYFNVISIKESQGLLKEIISTGHDVAIWKKGQEESDLEYFEIIQQDEIDKEFFVKKKGGFIHNFMQSVLADCDIFIKVDLEKLSYFAQGHLKATEKSKTYHLVIHEQFFKSQQRRNYRLASSKHVIVQFKIDEEVFDGNDVSAGGISINAPMADNERFAVGKEFDECTLRINKEQYDIKKAKIVKTEERLDAKGRSIGKMDLGIEFLNVPKVIEENIRQQINYEARGVEIRKKFNLG